MSSKYPGPPLRVLVIVASTRPGRLGPAIADWFVSTTRADAGRDGISLEIADLGEIGLPFLDEPEHPSAGAYVHEYTKAWSERVAAADAFVIVTPEYNYGMPAVLKNALDFLYHEWAWKPVAFVSYGNTSAGTRSVQMSKQVVTTLKMVPIGATVALRIADSTRDGRVQDSPEVDEGARRVLVELGNVSRATRALRPLSRGEGSTVEGPLDGLTLDEFQEDDLAELLVLQRCCWVQEALANDTFELAPLHDTLDDLRDWVLARRVWCVRRRGRLVAAVGAASKGSSWHIGRLMVAPDQAGHGIGSWLLAYVEQQAPESATHTALFTGRRSHRNIALYERAGYTVTPAPGSGAAGPDVYLTKLVRANASV